MDLRILITGGIIIFSLLVIFIILFIFLYQKRYYRHIQEKEQLRADFARETLNAQLEIQEQTLKNIAQEIHDNIGQVLSLAKLNLFTMDVTKQTDLIGKIVNSKELVSKAIQDLRDLSRSLNTDSVIDMGLIKAIGHELELIQKIELCHTHLDVQGELPKLDEKKELILFRIVQESLHNIIKHASAKNISVTIINSVDIVELIITDDGKGFDVTEVEEKMNINKGMGLRNMQNRARLIHAEFKVNSSKDTGTRITLLLSQHNKS